MGTKLTDDGSDSHISGSADIILDADGGDVIFKDGGTAIGTFTNSSSDFVIQSNVQDKDIIFKGDDGGSPVTALTLDMSAAGNATFNGDIYVDKIRRASDSGTTTKMLLNDEVLKLYAGNSSNEVVNIASGVVTVAGNLAAAGFIDSSWEVFSNVTSQAIATTGTTLLMLGGDASDDTYTLAAGTVLGQTKKISCVCDATTGCGSDDAVVTVTDAAWAGSGTITFSELSYIELIWVTVPGPANRWIPVTSTATLG